LYILALAAQKASRTLGYIPSSVASRAREGILRLLCSGEIPLGDFRATFQYLKGLTRKLVRDF